jgi:hypothetical protein
LPTTIPSSRRDVRRQILRDAQPECGAGRKPAQRRAIALLCITLLSLFGCTTGRTTPHELFVLAADSAANKAMQTRQFETPNSNELLSASAAVLQDLGFQVTESDRDLGFLRAAKERSAREYGQEVQRSLIAFVTAALSVLGGSNAMVIMPVDLHQQINASLIALPLHDDEKRQEVRVVFYRLVWKDDGMSGNQSIPPGQQKMEMIRDAEIYQQFFARLSKAAFLEAQKI